MLRFSAQTPSKLELRTASIGRISSVFDRRARLALPGRAARPAVGLEHGQRDRVALAHPPRRSRSPSASAAAAGVLPRASYTNPLTVVSIICVRKNSSRRGVELRELLLGRPALPPAASRRSPPRRARRAASPGARGYPTQHSAPDPLDLRAVGRRAGGDPHRVALPAQPAGQLPSPAAASDDQNPCHGAGIMIARPMTPTASPTPQDTVTMEKIVALCKRRGFVFPSSEIYGGVGSTYDFGHYGVLLKNNLKNEWWRAMLQERDDIVAIDSAILQHPRVWEASGHLAGFTDPLVDCRTCKQRFRADHLQELAVRAQTLPPPRRSGRVRADRGARLQPHVRDHDRTGQGVRRRPPTCAPRPPRGSSSTSRTCCSSRARNPRSGSPRSASPSATRSRPATSSSARASSSRWRWSSSCRRRTPSAGTSTGWASASAGTWSSASAPPTCACARTTPTSCPTTPRAPATSSTCSRRARTRRTGAGRSSRGSPTAATSTSPATREFSGEKLEYFDQASGERYVPHVIEPAAGRRPRDARLPRRRLRRGIRRARGRRRGRAAHRAAPAPAARAREGGGAAAGGQGRPAGARARGPRRGAPAGAVRVRRRAARSAAATAARTRSARPSALRSTTRASRTAR